MGELNPFSAPKVASGAAGEVAAAGDKAATARRALLETEGGIMGEEVQEVKKRQTILGN